MDTVQDLMTVVVCIVLGFSIAWRLTCNHRRIPAASHAAQDAEITESAQHLDPDV